jgi:hypothetical protein
VDVEVMAVLLRPAVDREVLRGRNRLVVARVVTLEPADERHSQAAGQVRVFAVRLLPAAPARVAEDVDVRRPEREPLVPAALALPHELVVLRASLVPDHDGHFVHERRVEGRRETDRLREDRSDARARDTVQRLVPPLVGRHVEPRDRGGLVRELRDLLGDGHARDEIARPPLEGELEVLVGLGRLRHGRSRAGGPRKGHDEENADEEERTPDARDTSVPPGAGGRLSAFRS